MNDHIQYDSIENALRKINSLLQEARIGGFDILQLAKLYWTDI